MRRVFLALLIAALALVTPASGSRGDVPTIRYANFKAFDPTFVAIEKGFFDKAGVHVEVTGNYPTGPSTVQGGGLGQVDAGLSSITGITLARAANVANVRGIADVQSESKKAPLERFYVKKDSSIRSIRDVKGKRVAVNGFSASFYYTWVYALRQAGVNPDDVQFINMPFAQQEQALELGQVDAIGLIDPFSRKVELDGYRRLFLGVNVLGEKQLSLIWFNTSFLAANPKAVRAFVTGYRQAIKWIYDNPRGAAGIMWKYVGVEPKYQTFHRYTKGAGIRMADIQWWMDFLRRVGDLKDGGKMTPASVATVRYTGDPGK